MYPRWPRWWLVGALLVAGACVTQTLPETQGPQWQPGATSVAAPPARRANKNKSPGEATATPAASANPAATPATAANSAGTAAAASATPAADPAAAPPAEPQLGQLQLLSPQDPAGEPQTDRAPRPIQPKSAAAAVPRITHPRVRQFYAYAAVYAAGHCRFANCAVGGWDTPHAEGDSESRCRQNSCLSQGWITTHPDGTLAEVRCRDGSCATRGWSTTYKDAPTDSPGAVVETRCLPAGCFIGGWTTTYPSGPPAQSHCRDNSCLQSGWTTHLPGGDVVECRCHLKDCARNGAECT